MSAHPVYKILVSVVVLLNLSSVAGCMGLSTTPAPTAAPSQTLAATALPLLSPTHPAPAVTPACFAPADLIPVAFMPDSTRLAVRSASGVQIFNLETLQEEAYLKAPLNVLSAALSPDGEVLVWSLEDNTLQLLRIADNSLIKTLVGHIGPVYKLRFSPHGERLYSASHDGWVRVWDKDGNPLDAFQPGGEVLGIGISSDETRLATIPFDGPVQLWDLRERKKIADLGGTGGYDTSDAIFSPDGQYLVTDLVTGLFMWRISDGELVWDEVKNSMAAAFSPDGRILAYSDIDQGNAVILSSPEGVLKTLDGGQAPVWELFFSPDGSKLVASDGVELRVWGVDDGILLVVGKYACP